MDHAEVLSRLEQAVVGPGKLARIETDRSEAGIALLRHLETCPECRREFEAWRRLDAAMALATPDDLAAPIDARSRVLAAVAAQGVARGPGAAVPPPIPLAPDAPLELRATSATPQTPISSGTRRMRQATTQRVPEVAASEGRGVPFRWLALAAAAAVVIFALGALLGGPLGLIPQPEVRNDLERVIGGAWGVLSDPDHKTARLETLDGQPGGFVATSWESDRLVVMSDTLEPTSDGTRYECFVVRDGQETRIGNMNPVGDYWFWAGTLEDPVPADVGLPGDEFVIRRQGATEPALSGMF
jgi:hypothetical protein